MPRTGGASVSKFAQAVDVLDFLSNPRKDFEIFGMFGPGNLGDEAMLVAALENLPRGRCVTWKSYRNRPLLNELIRKRRHSHLVVVGGTLIHGGETGWLDYIEHRSRQGVTVSFFGTGVSFTDAQAAKHPERIDRWCRILGRAPDVHLRGPYSVAALRDRGVEADVFGDFAMLLYDRDLPVTAHETREDVVGINVGECLADQALFEERCAALVRHLKGRYRLAFHVVVRSDLDATYRVIEKAGLAADAYTVERHYFDPRAFMASIRNYRAFVGLKLHAAGIAMIAGVPTLMVAYLPKCRDFMAPVGGEERFLIDLPLDLDALVAKVEGLLATPGESTLTRAIERISRRQKRQFEEFSAEAGA